MVDVSDKVCLSVITQRQPAGWILEVRAKTHLPVQNVSLLLIYKPVNKFQTSHICAVFVLVLFGLELLVFKAENQKLLLLSLRQHAERGQQRLMEPHMSSASSALTWRICCSFKSVNIC